MKRLAFLFLVLAIFLFQGCSKSSDQKDVSTTTKSSGVKTESDPNINEGKWEITVTTAMSGMPMKIPPQTYTTCMNKKDYIPKQDSSYDQEKCKIINQEISGDTVSWTLECKGQEGTIITKGRLTYKGDSFEGEVSTKIPNQGEMLQKMSGKRIGPC
ncbi:DUF3617 domain-containing protein [Thermodesulfovibrio hydrogeniphilus]